MTATNSAPAAWASRPISGIGSSRPRKSGWAAMTPATGRSGLGQHPLERGEVGRAGRRPVGDERDLVELEPALEVGPRASAR